MNRKKQKRHKSNRKYSCQNHDLNNGNLKTSNSQKQDVKTRKGLWSVLGCVATICTILGFSLKDVFFITMVDENPSLSSIETISIDTVMCSVPKIKEVHREEHRVYNETKEYVKDCTVITIRKGDTINLYRSKSDTLLNNII